MTRQTVASGLVVALALVSGCKQPPQQPPPPTALQRVEAEQAAIVARQQALDAARYTVSFAKAKIDEVNAQGGHLRFQCDALGNTAWMVREQWAQSPERDRIVGYVARVCVGRSETWQTVLLDAEPPTGVGLDSYPTTSAGGAR